MTLNRLLNLIQTTCYQLEAIISQFLTYTIKIILQTRFVDVDNSLLIVASIVGFCNCSMFSCALVNIHSSFAMILMGKRELVALLGLSSWCPVIFYVARPCDGMALFAVCGCGIS